MIDFEHMDEILYARNVFDSELNKLKSQGFTTSENISLLLEYKNIDIDTFSVHFANKRYSEVTDTRIKEYIELWYGRYNIGRGRV